jgi:uncharacterized protein
VPEWLIVVLIVVGAACVLLALTFAATLVTVVYYRTDILRVIEDLPVHPHSVDEELTEGEHVRFHAADGVRLDGRYLSARGATRRGVVIFSHEFGTSGDSAPRYAGFLLDHGFDLFTFDYRAHGRSETPSGYEPRQWPSDREFADLIAAVDYVTGRPDAPPNGVGVLGISRGAGVAISAAAHDNRIRAVVTDGAFASRETIIAYVGKWGAIYVNTRYTGKRLPLWFCHAVYVFVVRWSRKRWGSRFLPISKDVRLIAPRPILMIHGANDTYIPTALGERLFARARQPKAHWVVPAARHNQCYLAGQAEYADRICAFFDERIGQDLGPRAASPSPEPLESSAAEAS